jgi:hypothetical protein
MLQIAENLTLEQTMIVIRKIEMIKTIIINFSLAKSFFSFS